MMSAVVSPSTRLSSKLEAISTVFHPWHGTQLTQGYSSLALLTSEFLCTTQIPGRCVFHPLCYDFLVTRAQCTGQCGLQHSTCHSLECDCYRFVVNECFNSKIVNLISNASLYRSLALLISCRSRLHLSYLAKCTLWQCRA